ncbi:MAG: hypothetical protein CMH35_08675 [Microbacterium sp.]|uniref:hypothetical protein n=1 Tax=Microbacterium sp. UBA3394 TaxID=1946945 RepID=UPI000C46B79E|nr:hypothetical protein [Microbacterium sp. UBA3394]MAM54901.1 hypothetical protein [Microbacterium sp.]|tara:strand:- start:3426 stop:4415 length:990 start_codon:yes stop_codon:yes gene_type:complete
MSIEYSAFRRAKITLAQLPAQHYDLFLSSFNSSRRVQLLADAVNATRKVWIAHEEYAYTSAELPDGELVNASQAIAPAESWAEVLHHLGGATALAGMRVAIDITGMMRPHIAMLPFALKRAGVDEVTVYYSDPESYVQGERTRFTRGPVARVGLIPGMEGAHTNRPSPRDALIIGAGYDHGLVKAVADDKPNAEHVILLGLPSLQPHMYQESVLKLENARESIRDYRPATRSFAPANNPFATAQVIAAKVVALGELDHVYLTAVGTKPQVLGFAWYYWCEAAGQNTSFLFPFAERYEQDTTNGIATIHEYLLELGFVRDLGRPKAAAKM